METWSIGRATNIFCILHQGVRTIYSEIIKEPGSWLRCFEFEFK